MAELRDVAKEAGKEAAKMIAKPAAKAFGKWLRKRPFVRRVIRFFGGTP